MTIELMSASSRMIVTHRPCVARLVRCIVTEPCTASCQEPSRRAECFKNEQKLKPYFCTSLTVKAAEANGDELLAEHSHLKLLHLGIFLRSLVFDP